METMIKNSTMRQLMRVDPPRLEGQLEGLYRSIKRLQAYCIAINVVPDMAWKDFMRVYRHSQAVYDPQELEDLLNGKNQQEQLREYTAAYLDNLSVRLLTPFDRISSFSVLFDNCFDELSRTIRVRAENGLNEYKDYSLIIDVLVKRVKEYGIENKKLDEDLMTFSEKLQTSYTVLSLIKKKAEDFFAERKERIKQLEDELIRLNKALDSENNSLIRRSCLIKEGIQFVVFTKENTSSKQITAGDTNEANKRAKELEEKITGLKEELIRYDKDYTYLVILVDALEKFLGAFFSVIQGIRDIGRSWDDLEQFFCKVKEILDDPNTSKDHILNELLPFIDNFKALLLRIRDTISEFNHILPMDIIVLEEKNQQIVKRSQGRILNSKLLDIYLH